MSEYKTKLEEFTLEESQRIVSEALVGWEDYKFETEDYHSLYTKDSRCSQFIMDENPFWTHPSVPDYKEGGFCNREDIFKRIKLLEFVERDTPSPLQKLISTLSKTVSVEISEFVNEVKFVDGKIYLGMDKQDIEGVIKMLEEIRGG